MKIQNVVVAGPNGTIGAAVIRHLFAAGFTITALSRDAAKTSTAFPNLKAIETDYASVEGLTATLKQCGEIDAVVCLISRTQPQSQLNLIDATIAAKIPHYIPSSFGGDMTQPFSRNNPALIEKKAMEDHLIAKANKGVLTFTAINIGLFLDWALKANAIINLIDNSPIRIFDGGNVPISATVIDDAGKAVANALLKRDDLINRFCYIHSAKVTQQQLLQYAKEIQPEKDWQTVELATEPLYQQSMEKYEAGDTSMLNMRGFLLRGVFAGFNTFERTDNEILGIEMWSEERLKGLVREAME